MRLAVVPTEFTFWIPFCQESSVGFPGIMVLIVCRPDFDLNDELFD